MKNNFKKLLAALTVFAMALALVAVPVASAQAAPTSGTYKTGNTWWGSGSYMVGYAAESGTIEDLEKKMGYWPDGGFAYWTAITLDLQADGTWVVKEIIAPSQDNNLANVELKKNRLVVTFHEECLKDAGFTNAADNLAFFQSLKVGDTLSALGLWANEIDWNALAKNEDQATFTKIASAGSDNAGSDNAGSDNAGSDNAGSDNAGSNNAGSDNAGSNNAGSDSNVPPTGDSMPVALMATVLLASVAIVAYGLKKRNA